MIQSHYGSFNVTVISNFWNGWNIAPFRWLEDGPGQLKNQQSAQIRTTGESSISIDPTITGNGKSRDHPCQK